MNEETYLTYKALADAEAALDRCIDALCVSEMLPKQFTENSACAARDVSYKLAVSSLSSSLGAKPSDLGFRIDEISMESITEDLKNFGIKAWRAISDFIDRIIKMVREWGTRLFGQAEGSIKKAEEAVAGLDKRIKNTEKAIEEENTLGKDAVSGNADVLRDEKGNLQDPIMVGRDLVGTLSKPMRVRPKLAANLTIGKGRSYIINDVKDAIIFLNKIVDIAPIADVDQYVSSFSNIKTKADLDAFIDNKNRDLSKTRDKINSALNLVSAGGAYRSEALIGNRAFTMRYSTVGKVLVPEVAYSVVRGGDVTTIPSIDRSGLDELIGLMPTLATLISKIRHIRDASTKAVEPYTAGNGKALQSIDALLIELSGERDQEYVANIRTELRAVGRIHSNWYKIYNASMSFASQLLSELENYIEIVSRAKRV